MSIVYSEFLRYICGLDEVGRGALAGPLIGVSLKLNQRQIDSLFKLPLKICDSKKLTRQQRQTVYTHLIKLKVAININEISVGKINDLGIGWANRELFIRLVNNSHARHFIVDGNMKLSAYIDKKVTSIINADQYILPVVLAGIVAKVERDNYMKKIHYLYPYYRWNTNSGYGTLEHIGAIKKYGPSKHHRKQFVDTALKNKN